MTPDDPHASQLVLTAGATAGSESETAILVHGRNAGPENILDLVPQLDRPQCRYLAPGAYNGTWYPNSFLAPIESNEPGLSSGLRRLSSLLSGLAAAGVPADRVVLMGFSQGACLTAEFARRHPQRFGGLVIFSGGVVGPQGTSWANTGDFAGTPVFFGCSDVDAHVPKWRVDESAALFEQLGARVTKRIYPGMGHLVNDDEIRHAQAILDAVGSTTGAAS